MTDTTWPTAPVIRARWREHGYTHYVYPSTYIYGPDTGEYFNPGTGKWHSPEHGEFTDVTKYVEATQLEKRLDQIRQLENALRKKNHKLRMKNATIKNLGYQRKLASGTTPARARIRKDRLIGLWWVHVNHGGNSSTYMCATHADAITQATKKLAAINKEVYRVMA